MSKKKKSKKRRQSNIVDSRSMIQIKHHCLVEQQRLDLYNKAKDIPAFFIYYNITDIKNKSNGNILINNIKAYYYRFQNIGTSGSSKLWRVDLTKDSLDHAFIQPNLINNIKHDSYPKGCSIVSIAPYLRVNKTNSIGFIPPSPTSHIDQIAIANYETAIHINGIKYIGPFLENILEDIDSRIGELIKEQYPHLNRDFLYNYINNISPFFLYLNKQYQMHLTTQTLKYNNMTRAILGRDPTIFDY